MKFEFVDERERHNAKIKVMGIGGAGGNAINNMISSNLKGVSFIAANTDCQDLDRSACSHKIQLGPSVTMGLGAGSDPEIGESSAEESIHEIREAIDGADMVFITAGMGGGTGTGASPVVARESKEMGALTVAVVTKPFNFEGKPRMNRAMEGIEKLRHAVDSLIIIPNERLKALGSKTTTFKDLVARADEVLMNAVRGVSDLIISNGFINLDFADVKRVMGQMGTAIMGMGKASGENRAMEAARMAVNSPLLEDMSIEGAKGLLMNITGPSTMTMEEIDEASNYIKDGVSEDAEIYWGVVFDDTMEEEVQVTVVATGIDGIGCVYEKQAATDFSKDFSNVIKIRDLTPEEIQEDWTVRVNGECLDTPTFQRKGRDLTESPQEERPEARKRGILDRLHFKGNLDYPTYMRLKAD